MTRGITATERQLLEEESRRIWEIMRDERDVALRRVEAAEVSATLLREALEQVEFVESDGDPVDDYCPWCFIEGRMGRHGPKCKREAALATDAGAKMLAVVNAARTWVRAENWRASEPAIEAEQRAIAQLVAALDALDAKGVTE